MLIIIIKIAPTGREKQNQNKALKSPKHITEATETLFLELKELILTAVTHNILTSSEQHEYCTALL